MGLILSGSSNILFAKTFEYLINGKNDENKFKVTLEQNQMGYSLASVNVGSIEFYNAQLSPELRRASTEVVKVKVGPSGFASIFWSVNEYFRTSDAVFVGDDMINGDKKPWRVSLTSVYD